jgi:hypothetical protein
VQVTIDPDDDSGDNNAAQSGGVGGTVGLNRQQSKVVKVGVRNAANDQYENKKGYGTQAERFSRKKQLTGIGGRFAGVKGGKAKFGGGGNDGGGGDDGTKPEQPRRSFSANEAGLLNTPAPSAPAQVPSLPPRAYSSPPSQDPSKFVVKETPFGTVLVFPRAEFCPRKTLFDLCLLGGLTPPNV